MAMKASVDVGADLRNHDPDRQWDRRYAKNEGVTNDDEHAV
jgi:hypothetical protein